MKILIVDDSLPFLNALGAMLRDAGYSGIVMKESAPAAVEYLQSPENLTESSKVDIILMDVMMPEMNGIEAVRHIKAVDELRDIPIVMVSTGDEEEKIKQAFDAGAIDFIGKPVKKLELHARVRSILKLKEERDRRKAHEEELEKTVEELQKALTEVKTLSGLLPICSFCKKIRDDKGYWQQVERYVSNYADVDFSHSICPDCLRKHYPDQAEDLIRRVEEKRKSEDK